MVVVAELQIIFQESKRERKIERTCSNGGISSGELPSVYGLPPGKCDEFGVDREEVAEAVKVGLMVNRGAEKAIRKKTRELLGDMAIAD
jgi:hypothetical protein